MGLDGKTGGSRGSGGPSLCGWQRMEPGGCQQPEERRGRCPQLVPAIINVIGFCEPPVVCSIPGEVSMRFRRLLLFGLLGVAIILAALIGGFIATLPLRVRIALADEQTFIFDEMRIKAEQADTAKALGCLEYTLR